MDDLYNTALMAHFSNPYGLDRSIDASHCSEGYNARCGDEITFYLAISNGQQITDIAFESESCAVCTASASILCQLLRGKSRQTLHDNYQQLTSLFGKTKKFSNLKLTSELASLSNIALYPSRINCALLPWQTALDAIQSPITRTTES
jgi:nitrogen fixation protein NifU and related proteins